MLVDQEHGYIPRIPRGLPPPALLKSPECAGHLPGLRWSIVFSLQQVSLRSRVVEAFDWKMDVLSKE